jgi:hypothetical protein
MTWQKILKTRANPAEKKLFRSFAKELFLEYIKNKNEINTNELEQYLIDNIKEYSTKKLNPTTGQEKARISRGSNVFIKRLRNNSSYIGKLLTSNGFKVKKRLRDTAGARLSDGSIYERV